MKANKQKKKIFIIFGTVVIVSAVLGFFAGFLGDNIKTVLTGFDGQHKCKLFGAFCNIYSVKYSCVNCYLLLLF